MLHYHEYITYLLSKRGLCYPSPLYGKPITRQHVIDSWKKTTRSIINSRTNQFLSLYIHLPFCKSGCLYCMSGTLKIKDEKNIMPEYLKLLYAEMKAFSEIARDIEIATIYVGGGTPSLLTTQETFELLKNIHMNFKVTNGTRIFFEASPFTLNKDKIRGLKQLRIHELDMGIQSFEKKVLAKNRRPQDTGEAIELIKYAKKIGIPSVTIDLMTGMPYQNAASSLASAKKAISLPIDGIYLNPFRPFECTRFSLEGNRYTAKQARLRNQTASDICSLLRKNGFVNTPMGYRLKWSKEDQDRIYLTQEANNLMSFGHGCFSHAIGTLKYQQFLVPFNRLNPVFNRACEHKNDPRWKLEQNLLSRLFGKPGSMTVYKDHPFRYIGLEIDEEKEKNIFAYTYLQNLSTEEFKIRFGEDFCRIFRKELTLLEKNGLLSIEGSKVLLQSDDPVMRRVVKSFFIDKDYKKKVVSVEGERYDRKKDYRSLISPLVP